MYVRYYDARRRLSHRVIRRLHSVAHIYEDLTAAKFRMPIFIANVPGHAFNAILVDANATDINSYLFLEPQTDSLFDVSSPNFRNYFRVGILGLSRLTGFSERGAYEQTSAADFVRGARGVPMHQQLTSEQRVALSGLMRDLFIAGDWDTWKYTVSHQPRLNQADHMRRIRTDRAYCSSLVARFEAYIRSRGQLYSDEILAFVGRFVAGREFARYPGGPTETMTQATYIQLMNKPTLRRLMR